MTGQEAYALAQRKARYGHKAWIVWRGRDGTWNAAVETVAAVRQAMLDVGTQGRWTAIGTREYVQRWRDGVRILSNARVGVYPNTKI